MEQNMQRDLKLVLIILVLVAVASAAWIWALSTFYKPFKPFQPSPPPASNPGDLEIFYAAKTVVSSVNIALLVFLLILNAGIFRKTQSKFTLGLLIFSAAFLFKDFTASPIVTWVFGYHLVGLGPFALLPDLFESVVLVVLLHLCFE